MKKIGNECYAGSQEELSSMIGISIRHIFSLIKLGGPQKTDSGYPVKLWVNFLINRAKKPKKKSVSTQYDVDLEKMLKELEE